MSSLKQDPAYTYNAKLSKELAEKYPREIEKNQCYSNVYRVLSAFPRELEFNKTEVLFCYLPCPGYYVRHAFILYDDQIVEPLLHLDVQQRLQGIVTIERLSWGAYIEATAREGNADLFHDLNQEDIEAYEDSGIDLNYEDIKRIYMAKREVAKMNRKQRGEMTY